MFLKFLQINKFDVLTFATEDDGTYMLIEFHLFKWLPPIRLGLRKIDSMKLMNQIEQAYHRSVTDISKQSDGYHTFDELYEHRHTLYISLCKHRYATTGWGRQGTVVWRSRLHSDGSSYAGWFVLGIYTEPGQQITYHLPISKWDECDFAETLEKAPEFDGHTSTDVLKRISQL